MLLLIQFHRNAPSPTDFLPSLNWKLSIIIKPTNKLTYVLRLHRKHDSLDFHSTLFEISHPCKLNQTTAAFKRLQVFHSTVLHAIIHITFPDGTGETRTEYNLHSLLIKTIKEILQHFAAAAGLLVRCLPFLRIDDTAALRRLMHQPTLLKQ